jgi:hypothetical protein
LSLVLLEPLLEAAWVPVLLKSSAPDWYLVCKPKKTDTRKQRPLS